MRLKKIIFIALTFSSAYVLKISAQDYNFAWLNIPGAGAELESVVEFINDSTDAKFVLFTGIFPDLTDNADFDKAKSVIKKLKIPYYIIPGNSDVQWSGHRLDYNYTFDNDRFTFEFENEVFIGLSSAIHWRGSSGHIYPEDLEWLKNQLKKLRANTRLYFIVSNNLVETTDNWFKITNLLRDYNIQAILCGGGTENQLISINQIPGLTTIQFGGKGNKSWHFTMITSAPDSLLVYDIDKNNSRNKWISITKNINPLVELMDSTEFKSPNCEIIFNTELNATLAAPPVYYAGKIYTADYYGLITCYDTTGNVIWDYDAFGNMISKPAIADNIFIAATLQGDLITLNASTGEQIQTIGFDDQITSSLITIEYKGNKGLLLPKFTDSKSSVILGTASGKLYCYDLETMQEYWVNSSAKGGIITEPLHVENKIIYGSRDGFLYCIDAREGWLIWKWPGAKNIKYAPAGCSPVTDGNNIYFSTIEAKIFAVNLQLGKTIWQSDKFDSWESLGINQNRDRVLVKSTNGKLHIVETRKGTNRKTIDLKIRYDSTPIPPSAWEGNIFVPAADGYIYKIDTEFTLEELLFLGTAAINSFIHITDNIFLSSNIDGRVVLFKIN